MANSVGYFIQGIAEGKMDYPKELSALAVNRIEEERLKAKQQLRESRSTPPPKGFAPRKADEYELWRYILGTVRAFSHEACELVKQAKWTKAVALEEMIDFRRRFTIQAYREIASDRNGVDFEVPTLGWMANAPGMLKSDLERVFNNSAEWQECEAEVLAVTVAQAEGTNVSQKPERRNSKPNESADPSTHTELAGEVENTKPTPRQAYRPEIKAYMKAHDLGTNEMAARHLGVGLDTLKSIMSGKGKPRFSQETLEEVLKKIGFQRS
jgi:hypothetical protein